MADCIFCKIASKEVPARIAFEDDLCVAFHDASPRAPVHVLVIPRAHATGIAVYDDDDRALIGHVMRVACKVAADLGVGEGFRLVTNNGASAGQSVFHWHVHVLGGRAMSWPPG